MKLVPHQTAKDIANTERSQTKAKKDLEANENEIC